MLPAEPEDLAKDVALEATHDLGLRLALPRAAGDVVECGRVDAHARDDDAVEGRVGLTVAASVQPVAVRAAA